mmetsp:Transcript_135716/g.378086  ORF Transcript_135716/g.378086 Transcript_135716/m.378086 type:complete len:241 (+) Transcript_135716:319-1041(+)
MGLCQQHASAGVQLQKGSSARGTVAALAEEITCSGLAGARFAGPPPVRTSWRRRSLRLPHSRSMACGSPATSLTLTILSPGSSTFSAAPLLPHCLFQASAAPPGSTPSMRRWQSRPPCEVVRPSSVPSASRSVRPKMNASTSSVLVLELLELGEPELPEVDGVSGAGVVIPSTSARDTFAAMAGICLGCDRNGNAGRFVNFGELTPPTVVARHSSSMGLAGWLAAHSLTGEGRLVGVKRA